MMVYITKATPASIQECAQKLHEVTLLKEEFRENHTGDYPLHNRFFSNGDKPWVIVVNLKNPLKLHYDGKDYLIQENELVLLDDNVMHSWVMRNNDLRILFYRAKSEKPITSGTYCIDDYF